MEKEKILSLLEVTFKMASLSPDPSTQNGALLANDNGEVLSVHWNHVPSVGSTLEPKHIERPGKYYYFEHAERAVIYVAASMGIATKDLTMICPWFSCADCARAIVEAGIKEVIGLLRPLDQTNDRWKESCDIGDEILDAGGVKRTYIDLEGHKFGIKLRRNGELIEF